MTSDDRPNSGPPIVTEPTDSGSADQSGHYPNGRGGTTTRALTDHLGPVLLTPRLIGDVNRSRILGAFCDHGPTTRADLARLASVPRATIGAIAQGLIDDGLLEELEPDRSSGKVGKPGRPLWFRRDAGRSAAVVFDAAGCQAALVNARGEVLARNRSDLDVMAADASALKGAVAAAISGVLPATGTVLGIGLAIPGVCDTATGTILGSTQLPSAAGTGLSRGLAATFGLPVLVDNDARIQALGEKWFGDGRGVPTFASVQTGDGLGVGLVLRGTLYRGEDGRTGELGHTVVDRHGAACACGMTGCWETIATRRWLRSQADELGLPSAAGLDAQQLSALADGGNAAALRLRDAYADNLSIGLANLVHVMGLPRLLLHGDVVGGGEPLRAGIADHLRERLLPHLRDEVIVSFSPLDTDAGLLGAAGLVLSETFALAV